ncbi:hypothetical protein ACFFUE_10510 [Bergeyella porcorum]|uniref:hypothetical protein n=1 Tax=Bergeyella porcorum TaxID=1735111 RepID=UPI0035F0DF48
MLLLFLITSYLPDIGLELMAKILVQISPFFLVFSDVLINPFGTYHIDIVLFKIAYNLLWRLLFLPYFFFYESFSTFSLLNVGVAEMKKRENLSQKIALTNGI